MSDDVVRDDLCDRESDFDCDHDVNAAKCRDRNDSHMLKTEILRFKTLKPLQTIHLRSDSGGGGGGGGAETEPSSEPLAAAAPHLRTKGIGSVLPPVLLIALSDYDKHCKSLNCK